MEDTDYYIESNGRIITDEDIFVDGSHYYVRLRVFGGKGGMLYFLFFSLGILIHIDKTETFYYYSLYHLPESIRFLNTAKSVAHPVKVIGCMLINNVIYKSTFSGLTKDPNFICKECMVLSRCPF